MKEEYRNHTIDALPKLTSTGRYAVAVRISESQNQDRKVSVHEVSDKISYSLQQKAEKECVNFGRNLIDAGTISKKGGRNPSRKKLRKKGAS